MVDSTTDSYNKIRKQTMLIYFEKLVELKCSVFIGVQQTAHSQQILKLNHRSKIIQNFKKKKNAMCKRNAHTHTHQNIQIKLFKSYSFNLSAERELQIKQSIIKHSLNILTYLHPCLNIMTYTQHGSNILSNFHRTNQFY